MIRVLVVDDSPTLRTVIQNILEVDPEMKVVGKAKNGKEAVMLCQTLNPDVITMDIRMPEMNGYQAIRHIMAESPRPIVVLTSTQSDRELGITFKAVEHGALMVLGKPISQSGVYADADHLRAQVKAMARVKVVRRRGPLKGKIPAKPQKKSSPISTSGTIKIIAIGASTGGPPALQAILSQLPDKLSVPVVVVQHISAGFVTGLARWLNDTVDLRVRVADESLLLQPGHVYVAPDDHHLIVAPGRLARPQRSPLTDGHRPSVTVLFDSVARHFGSTAVGVLLTGMGADGARGLKTLRDAGGHTIVQDEVTSIVFGMPNEAIKLGAAREVVPLGDIAKRLTSLIKNEELRVKSET
ncbi:MAG: chemotaxis-specific protein-glutamate methyltransferase CheB [Desulfobacteraceae bacterium]|uniref:Protein-glutamate methylesterase/protein-glutamine glutaminase n=1 Tax=Candidatus Desulfacyla euxinica TaxID=2841693 RepID=A0A8J6N1B5_9DELT|nr:chemotaxis-specific protein-glutamate methyltransferase CheB [Candidatus Desulfacyla euxinica]MBL6977613.1 chemotaxis-specific protein-glutamate methyltransferase CheB [Desulfobacteraceae bacterium]